MESQVKSQISDKVYEATLDDLYELDENLEVDLYKINVFNKDIMIAPGKIMSDAKKDIHYCYVYVIQGKRVAAKLGIYETRVKKDEVYDLTDFEGPEFLLFDYYYNTPRSLDKYEMEEESEDNIFDYLKRFLKPVKSEVVTIKEQRATLVQLKKKMNAKYDPLLVTHFIKKKDTPYDEAWLDSFKKESDHWMFILIVLEVILNVRFIFEDSDQDLVEQIRGMVSSVKTANPLETIRVSLGDTPRHITTAIEEEPAEESEESAEESEEPAEESEEPAEESEELASEVVLPSVKSKTKPVSEVVLPSVKPKPKPASEVVLSSVTPKTKPSAEPIDEDVTLASLSLKPKKTFTTKPPLPPASTSESKLSASTSESKPVKKFSSKPKQPVAESNPPAEPKETTQPESTVPKQKTPENKEPPPFTKIPSNKPRLVPKPRSRTPKSTVPPPPKESPPKNNG